jgi:hypothetical protein
VDAVRALLFELQASVVAHSGKVLDLVTAAHMNKM